MQIKEHSAQLCPICQRPWQACYDQTNSKKQKEQWDSNKDTSLLATGPTPPDITGKGGQQTAHDDWQRNQFQPLPPLPPPDNPGNASMMGQPMQPLPPGATLMPILGMLAENPWCRLLCRPCRHQGCVGTFPTLPGMENFSRQIHEQLAEVCQAIYATRE